MRHAKDFSKKPINIGQKWRKKDAPGGKEVNRRGLGRGMERVKL
jgi:hypothetical protein